MKPLTATASRGSTQNKAQSGKWPIVLSLLLFCGLGGFFVVRPQFAPPVATPQTTTTAIEPKQIRWQVVNSYPHDANAFTQGLVWHNGGFYEGTGLVGKSQLRRVEFPSGKVLRKKDLPKDVFGEGVAMVGDKLYQLTWQSNRGFIYDRESFKLLSEFSYASEGWGLTYDGKHLILSDGTSTLTFLDPQTMQPVRHLNVTANGNALKNLNELEWINGAILANVWQTDTIVKIDPATGMVTAYLDLSGLLPQRLRTGKEDVLNGFTSPANCGRASLKSKLRTARCDSSF